MNIYNKNILEWEIFPEYDIIWTDPPWGQRMLKWFQTELLKQTGKRDNNNITDILNHLALKSNKTKPIFIEYSVKNYKEVIKIMESNGHILNECIQAIQSNGNPFMILSFNNNIKIKRGLKGFNNIKYVLGILNPITVFDPFAGLGKTAKIVLECGVNYIGSEINSNKCKRILEIK